MIARITAMFIALLALCALAPVLAQEKDPDILSLDNEFVRVVVNKGPDEAGRFSVRTTGGDPAIAASKNQHLIFGGNAPWTSYTSLLIDGEKYAFGGKTVRRAGLNAQYGKVIAGPEVKNGKIVTVCQYGDIEVTQELTFVRSLMTRMLDTVGITYRIANTGTKEHEVGVRVALDTMCGTNDGAPIRMGSKEIARAMYVPGNALDDNWLAFDSLSKPTVVSMGTLKGGATTPPDRVLFADWGSLADEAWDVTLAEGQGFIRKGEVDPDTAAALYWNPVTIDPDSAKSYTTYYGMGYVNVRGGTLTLGIVNPAETTFEHERTQPFTITAFVQNTGGFEGRNMVVTLTLPKGLELVSGNKLRETYDALALGALVQQSWTVRATGKGSGKDQVKLSVTSANIEPHEHASPIQVNVPTMKLVVTPTTQRVPLITNRKATIIPIQVTLSPSEELYGARFVLTFDPAVVRPFDVSRGRGYVDEGRLLAGWDVDDTAVDEGRLVITGFRTGAPTLTQAEINLALIKFRALAPGKSALTLQKAVLIDEKGNEKPLDTATGEIIVLE